MSASQELKHNLGVLVWTQSLCKYQIDDSTHRFCKLKTVKKGLALQAALLHLLSPSPRRKNTFFFFSRFSTFFSFINFKSGVLLFPHQKWGFTKFSTDFKDINRKSKYEWKSYFFLFEQNLIPFQEDLNSSGMWKNMILFPNVPCWI